MIRLNDQEKIMRLRALEQQAAEVQARMEEVARAVEENQATLAALNELEKNARTFSAIGSGVYVKTRVEDPENVLASVGENVLVEIPVQEARKKLEKAGQDLENGMRQLAELQARIRAEYARIMEELEKEKK